MTEQRTYHRFFVGECLTQFALVELSPAQVRQATRVLRLGTGDEVVVFDGRGLEATGTIEATTQGEVGVRVREVPRAGIIADTPEIHLGVALLRGDRLELVIQKAAELGVLSVSPMETQRCVVRLGADRARNRQQRWQRIAIEALEQSGRADWMEVYEPVQFEDLLSRTDSERRLIAWEQEPWNTLHHALTGSESSVTVMIGPEGGFTESEVARARESGFEPVSLGDITLRSETAAISIPALVRSIVTEKRLRRQANESYGTQQTP